MKKLFIIQVFFKPSSQQQPKFIGFEDFSDISIYLQENIDILSHYSMIPCDSVLGYIPFNEIDNVTEEISKD